MMDFLAQLTTLEVVSALRQSIWVYPLVNAAHILGIGLLIGSITVLNLRMLGFYRAIIPVRVLAKVCVPVSAAGLGLAAVTGLALFSVSALDYVRTDVFLVKLGITGVSLLNIAWVRASPVWREIVEAEPSLLNATEPDPRLKLGAALSLLLWVATLVCGRLVGYLI